MSLQRNECRALVISSPLTKESLVIENRLLRDQLLAMLHEMVCVCSNCRYYDRVNYFCHEHSIEITAMSSCSDHDNKWCIPVWWGWGR